MHAIRENAPKIKRKGYRQNESRAIVLLCTHRGKWVHFLFMELCWFSMQPEAVTVQSQNNSYSRVHLPFRISILQEHKKKD